MIQQYQKPIMIVFPDKQLKQDFRSTVRIDRECDMVLCVNINGVFVSGETNVNSMRIEITQI